MQRYLILPKLVRGAMTSGMTAFMVAVGGTSLVCFLLMNRGKPARPGVRVQAATPRAQALVTVPEAAGARFLVRQRQFFVA